MIKAKATSMTGDRPNKIRTRAGRLARGVLEASPDCIWLLDKQGTITFLNGAGTRLLNLVSPQQTSGQSWVSLWPPASRGPAINALESALKGNNGTFAGLGPTAGGAQIWWDVAVSPIRDRVGDISQVVVIARDVTIARQVFQDVELARNNLATVLSSTTDSIVAVDRDWTVTYLNKRAADLVGRDGAFSVGKNLWEVYPGAIGSEFHQYYIYALETQTPVQFEGYLAELSIWLEVHAFPTNEGLSIFFRDISDAKRARDEIYRLAHHDPLTGLPNRTMFLKRLDAATSSATLAERVLALVYIDLDDFKVVNDTWGHDAGDALLVATASRLSEGLRGKGICARIGGDEFAILLDEDVDRAGVERLVLALHESLARPVKYSNVELSSQASIGIALYPESDPRVSLLMKNADLALYQAKRSGGKQFAFFDPRVRDAIQRRLSALSCARDALERDAIVPFYQPKVSFRTGQVVGFEALLRWVHPREGVQPPFLIKDAFLDPILSVELGRRIREKVVGNMKVWRDRGVRFGSVALNVAAPEFVHTDFAAEVMNCLGSANLDPSSLEIEVTETVFLDDGSNRVETALAELHRSGVSIALDDFGTGYASLTHLNRFPVSWLKIDRSFVTGVGVDPDATAIVRAVMGLSHSMGMQVVAEGVETPDQWKLLKKAGCDVAQGYIISKPMSADQVPPFLERWPGADHILGTGQSTLQSRRRSA